MLSNQPAGAIRGRVFLVRGEGEYDVAARLDAIAGKLAGDREETYEDPCIIGADARDKAYGEWDFVRRYGCDFEERLKEASFDVEKLFPAENLSDDQRKVHGVWNDRIFVCSRKQQ